MTGAAGTIATTLPAAAESSAMLRQGGSALSTNDRRVPYRSPIRVALDHRAPTRPAPFRFVDAQARDLSGKGMSFIASVRPDTEWLVVELGSAPDQVFLRCRVMDSSPAEDDGMTLVDCQFCGRL